MDTLILHTVTSYNIRFGYSIQYTVSYCLILMHSSDTQESLLQESTLTLTLTQTEHSWQNRSELRSYELPYYSTASRFTASSSQLKSQKLAKSDAPLGQVVGRDLAGDVVVADENFNVILADLAARRPSRSIWWPVASSITIIKKNIYKKKKKLAHTTCSLIWLGWPPS